MYWDNWQESYELDVLSDGAGNWLADFGGAGMDLLPYMIAEPTIADTDGDRTSARLTEPPVLDVVRLNYCQRGTPNDWILRSPVSAGTVS